ncbi:MAG: D-alanine aminotransferase [Phycisphaerae bacterium]|nr:D-alanine aminotransferase [Phycisphaerae bacterium]
MKIEINNRLLEAGEASIAVTDVAVHYGIGLFETMRGVQGGVWRLEQHRQRLLKSAEKLQLPITPEMLPDDGRVRRLLAANELSDARVRLTVTGGAPVAAGFHHSVILSTAPLESYPVNYYEQGVTVLLSPLLQQSSDPLTGHKTTNYWNRLNVLQRAHQQGCVEALWFNERRELAEGCISNVFIVRNGELLTPPLDTPVLPGITRQVLIECGAVQSLPCRETALHINDLLDADEVLITNCLMGVIPVVRIERRLIGAGRPGPIARQLHKSLQQIISRESTPSSTNEQER